MRTRGGVSSNGRTAVSGTVCEGSTPSTPANVAPSSSGLGRRPLKAEIAGSNPVGATSYLFGQDHFGPDFFIGSLVIAFSSLSVCHSHTGATFSCASSYLSCRKNNPDHDGHDGALGHGDDSVRGDERDDRHRHSSIHPLHRYL